MITEATPFLNFNGDCHQAIELYCSVLGATIEDRRGWDPAMFDGGVVPEPMKNGVMYARLKLGNAPLELSDVPPHLNVQPGSNNTINLHVSEPDALDRYYAGLVEGGAAEMPPEDMFWGARYAKLTDRFGIQWSMHCQLETA